MMNPGSHFVVVGSLVTALLFAVPATADDAKAEPRTPDARLKLRGRTASVGVGFAWGASTLEFEGKTYPVRIDGFVAGAVGTASVEGVGEVYGLEKVEDLNGNYTAVAAGGAIGSGGGVLTMRNEKGVRIVIDAHATGLQLGLGPRGVTLAVEDPADGPTNSGPRLPATLGFGEAQVAQGFFLRPTLNGQLFLAASSNPGFDGKFAAGPIDEAQDWVEQSAEVGLNGRYMLGPEGAYGTLQARVSGVYSRTGSGPDGPACTGSENESADDFSLESAYLSWKSGEVFQSSLGTDAIELSGGNQNYQVFDGLLFWDGGQDCTGRGANWLSARKAFHRTGIATLRTDNWVVEGAHLKFNDEEPDTDTQLGLGRVEYATDQSFMEHLKLGALYYYIYDSENVRRDGMKGIYLHTDATPLRSLPGLTYKASFVRQSNSRSSGLTKAYGWYVAPAYQFQNAPWKPQIGYRYAAFSGGDDEAFDPLFAGLPEWGTWFQGELLGEYVLSNSNLLSHQIRLKMTPTDNLTVNLIYYKFLLDERQNDFGATSTRVSSSHLADEFDLIFDITPTNWWSVTATVSVALPNEAFRDAVGDDATWVNGYLYINLNF